MHLVDHARSYIEETYSRPWHDRLLRSLLAHVLPYPNRFRFALAAAMLAKPFKSALAALPLLGARLHAMVELAPRRVAGPLGLRRPRVHSSPKARAGAGWRILSGCAQPVLKPGFNEAAIRLLNRHGIEVVQARGEGCCGALVHHMGRESEGLAFARRNIDAWIAEMDGEGLDAIVITASGCGTTIKDYGFMFREDAAYAEKAARGLRHRQRHHRIPDQPGAHGAGAGDRSGGGLSIRLLHAARPADPDRAQGAARAAGFTVKDVPEGHICCGSAGTYNLLQPEIAAQLRARKVANIERTRPDVIATGNIGCMTQIEKGTAIPIVHTVELLDWATGGPMPEALEAGLRAGGTLRATSTRQDVTLLQRCATKFCSNLGRSALKDSP